MKCEHQKKMLEEKRAKEKANNKLKFHIMTALKGAGSKKSLVSKKPKIRYFGRRESIMRMKNEKFANMKHTSNSLIKNLQ